VRDAYVVEPLVGGDGSGPTPDYFEPVAAWAVWRLGRRGPLRGVYDGAPWPVGDACEDAVALRLEEVEWSPRSTAIGRVLLWGSVVETDAGWRATRAYPQRIFVPAVTRHELRRGERIARRLAGYGVPVRRLEVPSHADVVPVLLHAFPNESLFRPISEQPGRRSARP
jgi:hypothetical protein